MRNIGSQTKYIKLAGQDVGYILKVSRLARNIRIAIHPGGELIVTQPRYASFKLVENFLSEKAQWVVDGIENSKKKSAADPLSSLTRRDYLNNREKARTLVTERLEFYNHYYGFKYAKVIIRNQKTCWGSCSRAGNLNFNFRLLYLPQEVCDYVVVHELCHLKEFNHSVQFWNLIAKTIPDFSTRRKKLKKGQLI